MEEDEELWVRSPFCPDIKPILDKTITEFLWERTHQWGDALAFECGVSGRKYTYAELYRNSQGFAAGLLAENDGVGIIEKGDVMALVLPNMPEYLIALLGAWDAGCVVSPVNPAYTWEEIMRQLKSSEAKCAVTTGQFLPAVLKARLSCPFLTTVIVIDPAPQEEEGCLSFFELMKTDPMNFSSVRGSDMDTLTTTALLPYSSGTTGLPKGVMITHANLVANTCQFKDPEAGGLPEKFGQERTIGILPFFHVYGLAAALHVIHEGNFMLCLPRFDPVTFIDSMRRHKPTSLILVPPLISFLCQSPDFGPTEWTPLKKVIVGAATCGPNLIKKFLDMTNHQIFFQEGYGLTELSPFTHITNHRMRHTKIGSIGTPMGSTVCKVVDVQSGRTLGPNQKGELCVRGPQMMKGYLNNDHATANTIDPQGWLHTGDVCCFDEDKHFYIVDRIKDIIKVKGFQVSPSELEDLLREHEEVVDVAVIGVPDEECGEVPRAYIVQKGQGLTVGQINNFLKGRIATYKQLKGGVEFLEKIPKAPSGKILRRELLAEFTCKKK